MRMVKIVFFALLAFMVSPNHADVELPGFVRIGLQWITDNVQKDQLPQILKEVKQQVPAVENSVNFENILKKPGKFLAASFRKTLVHSKNPDGNSVQHHKKTNLIEVAKNLNLTTFLDKAKEAGIDDVLDHEGKFTVFAPTNEAFEQTPKFCANIKVKDLMKFHVSRGTYPSSDFKNNLILRSLLTRRGTRINIYKNSTVITANGRHVNQTDFKASNGILHVIDDVMCAVYRGGAASAISRCPKMTILTKAINITGLYAALERTKQLTVFAPTDAAFAKIPPETLDALINNVTALTEVLTYHVVPDVWYSAGLEDGATLKTLQGQNITIGVSENITVNDATVQAADATVRNGVVHGIDTVLLPSSEILMALGVKLQPVVSVI